MFPKQVFVRVQLSNGHWVSADVLDLDQASFNIFVIGLLFRAGVVVGLKDEAFPDTARLPLRLRPECEQDYLGDE